MIIDSDTNIPIENHFRVSAGPGAGKTHWLVNHIKNVLQTTTRLHQSRKIACITYTNIGVETIVSRLGTAVSQVEVSTIHSFLYKHVVKPYCCFLPDHYKLNFEKVDGHKDTFVSYKKVKKWIKNHPCVDDLKHPYTINQLLKLPHNKDAVINWLQSIKYEFDENNNLIFTCDRSEAFSETTDGRRYLSKDCIDILESGLLGYKKLYWQNGYVDHDDILFFSYELIKNNPFILTVLRAKFPYFFVDEFQDTNPIQAKLLNKIGAKETIIGVIGDPAQSIFEFQGARPKQFNNFSLENLKEYKMLDNRRSTNQIIDILNIIRKDIQQNKYRNENGEQPVIIIGERNKAFNLAKQLSNNEEVYSLSRKNITSNAMKKEVTDIDFNQNIFDQLLNNDSNSRRRNLIFSSISAVELARHGKYKEAIKEIEYLFRRDDKTKSRKLVLNCISVLLNDYNSYKDKLLMDFYRVLKTKIDQNLAGFRKGAPKTFYETHKYINFAICVNIVEDTSKHKTIHKAKGDEFDNVLLVTGESEFDFLLDPALEENEEHRIYYVAISRAKERLFINIPSLSAENFEKFEGLFRIESTN